MNAEHNWLTQCRTVRIRGKYIVISPCLNVSGVAVITKLVWWCCKCCINPTISLWSSGYWPMTGLDCHKLSNQDPDNRDCYCVVSRVCAVSSWCPRASLMSDLEKNNTKIHRAAENSTFLAKLCPDIRDWGWGKITRYCLTSNVMEPGHCSRGCQLYPEIGPYLINILIMKILWNPFLIPGTVIVENEIGTLLDLKQ